MFGRLQPPPIQSAPALAEGPSGGSKVNGTLVRPFTEQPPRGASRTVPGPLPCGSRCRKCGQPKSSSARLFSTSFHPKPLLNRPKFANPAPGDLRPAQRHVCPTQIFEIPLRELSVPLKETSVPSKISKDRSETPLSLPRISKDRSRRLPSRPKFQNPTQKASCPAQRPL